MKKIRLIICDDHPLICEGLLNHFSKISRFALVKTVSSLAALELLLAKEHFDVLILDVNLPDGSGTKYAVSLRQNFPDTKIIILTNVDDLYIAQSAIENGAAGFILKNESTAAIENAVYEIINGGSYISSQIKMALEKNSKQKPEHFPIITKREKEVLEHLSTGLSSAEIAEKMFISTETVHSHRKSLLQKFDVGKTVLLIQKAKEMRVIE